MKKLILLLIKSVLNLNTLEGAIYLPNVIQWNKTLSIIWVWDYSTDCPSSQIETRISMYVYKSMSPNKMSGWVTRNGTRLASWLQNAPLALNKSHRWIDKDGSFKDLRVKWFLFHSDLCSRQQHYYHQLSQF